MKKNVLVTMPVGQPHKDLLELHYPEGEFIYKRTGFYDQADIDSAHIIIGNVPSVMLKTANQLEWLALNSSGYSEYMEPGVLPAHIRLTNAAGAYGLAVAEHMLALTFCVIKNLMLYRDFQNKNEWADVGGVTSIDGSVTLVVGLGDIGNEYARKMKALGSYVIGLKRTLGEKPEYMDEWYTIDHLEEQLKRADIVALILPESVDTKGLFSKEKFSLMKKGSVLINAGRGSVLCTDDFYDALNNGPLYGAGIDVTDPEPLPKDHKLWSVKNLMITPHKAGGYNLPETFERIIRIAARNLSHYANGEPLENVIK